MFPGVEGAWVWRNMKQLKYAVMPIDKPSVTGSRNRAVAS